MRCSQSQVSGWAGISERKVPGLSWVAGELLADWSKMLISLRASRMARSLAPLPRMFWVMRSRRGSGVGYWSCGVLVG